MKHRNAASPPLEHRFNDDLLFREDDRKTAKELYPEIYRVLDHQELRNEFSRYDTGATKARLWVHRIGLLAVALTAVALLGSALTPLLKDMQAVPTWVLAASFWIEVAGVVGVAIAGGGILIARQKRKWLEYRMMAEVLRIWHFQALICRGKEIESSCGMSDAHGQAEFETQRRIKFKAFVNDWNGTLDSHLDDLIDNPESGYQMLHDEPTDYTAGSKILVSVFGAYKSLRFRHQEKYAGHKLKKETSHPLNILEWPSTVLQRRTQIFSAFCLLGSLVISAVILISHPLGLPSAHQNGWPVGVIVLLILTVVCRAVQDGLAAPEEVQRYNDYAGKIRYLLGRFDMSQDNSEKLHLMVEMERAAFEELKGFLRAHSEARFVM